MSSSPWVWNKTTREYVFFSQKYSCWLDERKERVDQLDPAIRAKTPKPDRASNAQGSRARRPSEADIRGIEIEASLGRVRLQDEPSASELYGSSPRGNVSFGPIKPATARSGPRDVVAEDETTGIRTHWHISAPQQYTDPNTSQSRTVTLKDILRGNKEDERRLTPVNLDDRVSSKKGRAVNKVIEVRVVPPPPPTGVSQASLLVSDASGRDNGRIRTRRYVIVEERPERQDGRECFRALAITTNRGEGVRGQIKYHFAQIHSTRHCPDIMPGEEARPGERPMQTPAIRVEPYDREQRLDDKSRLDYCDVTDFDYGDPQVRLWGRVHKNSEGAFHSQYANVTRMVADIIRGPVPSHQTGDTHSANPPAYRPAGGGPGPGNSGGGTRSGAPAALQHRPPAAAPAPAPRERVLVADVLQAINALRDHARANDLHWNVTTTPAGLQRLANNRQHRESTLRGIRDNLNRQAEASNRQRESSSESDDDSED